MRTSNTFGIHFVLREIRGKSELSAIYMRIVVNKKRSEVSLKRHLATDDWSEAKGMAKPKNDELRKLNTHLEQLWMFRRYVTPYSVAKLTTCLLAKKCSLCFSSITKDNYLPVSI